LYRHIKNLSGDYVLLDLGAGSGHNTIDTFLIADKMIVVTQPEITAIENLYNGKGYTGGDGNAERQYLWLRRRKQRIFE
jgi:MinD-like ATPase involved in chromosome partitioning or flagellar assembly